MATLIIKIIIVSVCLLYIAQPKVSFPPFRASFDNPYYAIGLALITIGITFYQYAGYLDGKKAGIELCEQAIDEYGKEKKSK